MIKIINDQLTMNNKEKMLYMIKIKTIPMQCFQQVHHKIA